MLLTHLAESHTGSRESRSRPIQSGCATLQRIRYVRTDFQIAMEDAYDFFFDTVNTFLPGARTPAAR